MTDPHPPKTTTFTIGELIQIGGVILRVKSLGSKMLMLECMPGSTFERQKIKGKQSKTSNLAG